MEQFKKYKCVCGKEFNNSQSFNAHQGRCKIRYEVNGNIEQYKKRMELNKIIGIKASNTIKQNNKNKWVQEKHRCERCGKIMIDKFGSGRFCSRACANQRQLSDDSKKRISETLKSKSKNKTKLEKDEATKRKINRKKEMDNKHNKLYTELDMINSPYKEFNRIWISNSDGRQVFTFRLIDDDGNKIKSTVVPIYRYMIEHKLGRKLTKNEVVHHIDGDKSNNNENNLVVMTRSEHSKLHAIT